jgi:hypothetical protein
MTDGVYEPASQEEKDAMYNHLQVLDAAQEGVTLDKLRVFYPKVGWGSIITTLRNLRDDGRAKAQVKPLKTGGTGQFEHWTWL